MTNAVLVQSPPVCPTCKLAIHPADGGMLIVGPLGTFTGGHGHVVCPCGWWSEVKDGAEGQRLAEDHVQWHVDNSVPMAGRETPQAEGSE